MITKFNFISSDIVAIYAIIEAFNNTEMKLNMKHCIRELNKNKYSWDEGARDTIEIYKKVKIK